MVPARLRESLLVLLSAVLLVAPAVSRADEPEPRTHVVSAGNSLGSIAKRYGVTVAALREANELGPGQPIRLGQRLLIPPPSGRAPRGRASKDELEGGHGGPPVDAAAHAHEKSEGNKGNGSRTGYLRAPKRPGVVRLVHGAEVRSVKLLDRSRRLDPKALETFSRMLRFWPTGDKHAIDPRLVSLVGLVSDHFGGRDLIVVSGFRPFSPHQYTPHSNHNAGRAMDFAVRGVPNEAVRDFCKTLRRAGVGYYPNSSFVHLDVRETSAFWIDYAGPGEPPRYHRPDAHLAADEGAGEVRTEGSEPGPESEGSGGDPGQGGDEPP